MSETIPYLVLWNLAGALAIGAGCALIFAYRALRWLERPRSARLAGLAVALALGSGLTVWGALAVERDVLAAPGFPPGWTCRIIGDAAARVCFADRPGDAEGGT